MGPLRTFLLAAALAAGYLGQYLLDYAARQSLLPRWLLERFPPLYRLTNWQPVQLIIPGTILLVLGALLFALGAAHGNVWKKATDSGVLAAARSHSSRGLAVRRTGILLVVGATLFGLVTLLVAYARGETWWLSIVWAVALILLVAGSGWLDGPGERPARHSSSPGRLPTRWIVLVLLGTVMLLSWRWLELPSRLDVAVARTGQQALALLEITGPRLFEAGLTGAPSIAYLPTALALVVTRDPLTAVRSLGLVTGLLTVVATWLVGSELFRYDRSGDGSSPLGLATLAAALAAVSPAFLHFGRLTPFLSATAVGTLAAWLLLRALRTGSRPQSAVSGALLGLSLLLDRSGLAFLIVLSAWWAGILLVPQFRSDGDRAGIGQGLLVWLAGLFVVLAPVLGIWLGEPSNWTSYLRAAVLQPTAGPPTVLNGLWNRLAASILGFVLLPDASHVVGYPGHFLTSLLAPLAVLSLGALIRDLNRLVGWCLVTWMAGVVLISSLMNGLAPWWPTLLPIIPAVGLAITYGMESFRRVWTKGQAQWSPSTVRTAVIALIGVVAFFAWLEYQEFAGQDTNMTSAIGRAIRLTPTGYQPILVAATPEQTAVLADPVVTFLAAGQGAVPPRSMLLDELAGAAPTCARLVIRPDEPTTLALITRLYPGRTPVAARDLHANPTVYGLDLDGCPTEHGDSALFRVLSERRKLLYYRLLWPLPERFEHVDDDLVWLHIGRASMR